MYQLVDSAVSSRSGRPERVIPVLTWPVAPRGTSIVPKDRRHAPGGPGGPWGGLSRGLWNSGSIRRSPTGVPGPARVSRSVNQRKRPVFYSTELEDVLRLGVLLRQRDYRISPGGWGGRGNDRVYGNGDLRRTADAWTRRSLFQMAMLAALKTSDGRKFTVRSGSAGALLCSAYTGSAD